MTNELLLDRAQQYWLLARFNRPIGIYILLWPALWALWIAGDGSPDLLVLFVFCLALCHLTTEYIL